MQRRPDVATRAGAGVCHRTECVNVNNRFYARDVVDREVTSFVSKARARKTSALARDRPLPATSLFRASRPVRALRCISRSRATRPRLQLLLRGIAFGECDHPPAASPHFKHINCANMSHRVRLAAMQHACAHALRSCLPFAGSSDSASSIDASSFQFLDIWWEGNDLHATIQVLPTAAGAVVRDICLNGERCVAPHLRC